MDVRSDDTLESSRSVSRRMPRCVLCTHCVHIAYNRLCLGEILDDFTGFICVTAKKGGALASAVHSYTQHGDPAIRELVKHALALVSGNDLRLPLQLFAMVSRGLAVHYLLFGSSVMF